MFTNVSYVKCQNISISHVFSSTIRNAGFLLGKKKLLQNIFTFIFPIETTEDLAAFFFFIQRWNIKTSNIFCVWWATLLSHFLHLLSQPFRWKNLIREWIFNSWNEWNFLSQHIGRIAIFLSELTLLLFGHVKIMRQLASTFCFQHNLNKNPPKMNTSVSYSRLI